MNTELMKRFLDLLEQTMIKLEALYHDSKKDVSESSDAFKVSISEKAKRK